ncbi:hypothetical protein BGZ80_007595, partial [Entomortierella chlamydospora]
MARSIIRISAAVMVVALAILNSQVEAAPIAIGQVTDANTVSHTIPNTRVLPKLTRRDVAGSAVN